jgi:hypothetical protein
MDILNSPKRENEEGGDRVLSRLPTIKVARPVFFVRESKVLGGFASLNSKRGEGA